MPPPPPPEIKPFQAIILILSIITISALAAELIFDIPPEAQLVIRWADTCICMLFLLDFCLQFKRAESKLQYMKWGWIDLLASIPEIEALRWGRLFRVFRILRIFLLAKSLRNFISSLFKNRTEGGVPRSFSSPSWSSYFPPWPSSSPNEPLKLLSPRPEMPSGGASPRSRPWATEINFP